MKRSPSIVHVGNYLGQGCDGAAASLRAQVDALRSQEANISVWQFEVGLSEVSSVQYENGLTVHRLPRFRNPLMAALAVPSSSRCWLTGQLQNTDVVHLHSVFTPQNNFSAKLGVPYAVTPQGGWSERVLYGRRASAKAIWISLFERNLWATASFVQAVSRTEMGELQKLPKIGRIEFIPNGVTLPGGIISKPDRMSYFLFLGRLAIEQKGLDLLIDAYRMAHSESNSLPDLLLAGPDCRGGAGYLETRINSVGLSSRIRLMGSVFGEEKTQLLAGAYVFVHPSRWEGMPLSVLEALAHGTPCIVTQATGLADWIDKRNCGWSVESSASHLARALLHVARASSDVHEKSLNTRRFVAADYSWSSIADRLNSLYRQISRGNK